MQQQLMGELQMMQQPQQVQFNMQQSWNMPPQQQPAVMSSAQPFAAKAAQPKSGGISSFFGGLLSSISGKKQASPKNESKAQFYERERNLSVNECDSDDLDGDLNLSDSDDGAHKRASFKRQRRNKKKREANKYAVEADTNIFQVSLACLKNAGAMATGDPVICEKCQGVFNNSSQLKPVMGKDSKIWPCEFCNHEN